MDQSVSRITVGITGHRWNKIPNSEGARIAAQLATVFAAIDLAVQESGAAALTSVPTLRLVSALAEGADQLAVESRPTSWLLDAILPFPRERYLEDFSAANATGGGDQRPAFEAALAQAQSVIEISRSEEPVEAYERAGEVVLAESDILVAVWDGEPAAGRGGSEAVITRALSRGLPVIWIYSQHDRPPKLLAGGPNPSDSLEAVPATAETIGRIVDPIVKKVAAASHSHSVEPR